MDELLVNESHVRWMIRRDLTEVLEIDFQSYPYPWSEEQFISQLRQRNCIGMVVESSGDIVGFMIYELHKRRLNLLRLAVDPSHRRRGVGTSMVDRLKGKLSTGRRENITTSIHEDLVTGQIFLRDSGFKAICVDREAELDDRDSYLMHYGIRIGEKE